MPCRPISATMAALALCAAGCAGGGAPDDGLAGRDRQPPVITRLEALGPDGAVLGAIESGRASRCPSGAPTARNVALVNAVPDRIAVRARDDQGVRTLDVKFEGAIPQTAAARAGGVEVRPMAASGIARAVWTADLLLDQRDITLEIRLDPRVPARRFDVAVSARDGAGKTTRLETATFALPEVICR